jgi:predicted lipoprotein with Yx(FWY)xxD motif
MMNLGISSIEDGNGGTYDVHVTYFSDVNEYVVEYEGACAPGMDGAIRTNNWLDDDDLVSLGSQLDNIDSTSPCGTNVIYNYNDITNMWMVATLDSTGIDYDHNGLDTSQKDWAESTNFANAMPQWNKVYDMPSALTDVNDITNGMFGVHTFAEASADYDVLSAVSDTGDYMTTPDGMSLYIYWGDSDGNNPTQVCGLECQATWPAFFAGDNPMVTPPLDDDDFSSFTNSIGEEQTTYQGWPLYTYVGDTFATDVTGNGITDATGTWYVAGAGYETGPADECISSLTGGAPYSWSGTLCSGTYTLNMADSFGDGWNGNDFEIADDNNNLLFSATINSGSSASDTFTLDNPVQVYVTVNGGSWQSEVSWDFFTAGAVFSIEGLSSQSINADVPAGYYQLSMSDSWGDGWNGNEWTLVNAASAIVAGPFTLSSGSSGSETFQLTDDCNGCTAQVAGGSYIWETSWVLTSTIAPVDIFGDAEDFPGRMEASAPSGVADFGVFNFPAGTYTVTMTDTFGDGWNGNGLSLVGSNGAVVANVGLASGSFGIAEFTIDEGTYALDVGMTDTGSWDGEIGWSLSLNGYVPAGQHFTQICVTSNGVIAFTDGDDCSSSENIGDLFGFNGIMYQTGDTGFAAGASVYLQVQNILF